jgi:hypothetical protein
VCGREDNSSECTTQHHVMNESDDKIFSERRGDAETHASWIGRRRPERGVRTDGPTPALLALPFIIGGRSPKVIARRQNDYCLPFHGRRFSTNCTTKERLLQYNLTSFVPFLQELIKIKKKMQKNPKIPKLVLLGYLYLYL